MQEMQRAQKDTLADCAARAHRLSSMSCREGVCSAHHRLRGYGVCLPC